MARGKVAASEPEVIDVGQGLEVTSEDEQMVKTAGQAVNTFLGKLGAFFKKARQIEDDAIARLARAKELQRKPPTTADEDVAIQTFVRETTAASKEAIEHWNITQAVHGFHRRLTSARQRAVDANEAANTIGNKLHNDYVDAERQKAAAETERLRVEAERKAQADHDAEVARQEELAAKAEANAPTLSERESVFVDLVVAGNSASQAAQRAGFKNAATVGPQLLDRPKIAKAIEAKEQAAAIRAQAAAVKEQPLDVQFEEVQPDIAKASGASDRTYHGAKVVDADRLMDAVFSGKYGIPRDVLMVNPSKVNQYGKDLKELINKWPGVRYTKHRKVT